MTYKNSHPVQGSISKTKVRRAVEEVFDARDRAAAAEAARRPWGKLKALASRLLRRGTRKS